MNTEDFVTTTESNALVINVFTGIGLAALGMLITFIFFWSYNKDKTLFIVVLSVLFFLYALMQMVYFIVKRGSLGNMEFSVMLGASIFVEIMAVILLIIFSIVASRRLRGSVSSSYAPAAPVQNF
jgi:hypothetical protein